MHTHTHTYFLKLFSSGCSRVSKDVQDNPKDSSNNLRLHRLRRNDVSRVFPIHRGHLRAQTSQTCFFCHACHFFSAPESTCSIQRASSCLRSHLENRVQTVLTLFMELQAKLGNASLITAPCCSIAGHTLASTTWAVFTLRCGPAPCVMLL